MIYANHRLLWPKTYTDPEYMIPTTSDLRGLAFDPNTPCGAVVTFDQTERKLLWIQRDTGNVLQSAACVFPPSIAPWPCDTQVVDICVIRDVIHLLIHT
jgi:hypothetical protein